MHLISGLFLVVKDGSQTQNKPKIRPCRTPDEEIILRRLLGYMDPRAPVLSVPMFPISTHLLQAYEGDATSGPGSSHAYNLQALRNSFS